MYKAAQAAERAAYEQYQMVVDGAQSEDRASAQMCIRDSHRQDPVNEDILRFINRLSDLFFVMARMEMQRQDWPEGNGKSLPTKGKDSKHLSLTAGELFSA